MTADSQEAMQAALLSALRGDGEFTASLAEGADSVLDHVAAGSAYPYVVIGEARTAGFDCKTEDGMEQQLTLHTWSRYQGMLEAKRIMAAIVAALDRASLDLAGHRLVLLRFEFSEVLLDPDGITRHGVQRFRALTQAA